MNIQLYLDSFQYTLWLSTIFSESKKGFYIADLLHRRKRLKVVERNYAYNCKYDLFGYRSIERSETVAILW